MTDEYDFSSAKRGPVVKAPTGKTRITFRIVIKTFADKRTQEFYVTGRERRFPPEILSRALRRLEQIDAATNLGDLAVPPSNRLHGLEGDRKGQYPVSINEKWRFCFRFEDGDAFDVEVCEYH